MYNATTSFSYPQPPPTRRGRSSSRGTQFSIKNEAAAQIKPTELTGYYSSNSKVRILSKYKCSCKIN